MWHVVLAVFYFILSHAVGVFLTAGGHGFYGFLFAVGGWPIVLLPLFGSASNVGMLIYTILEPFYLFMLPWVAANTRLGIKGTLLVHVCAGITLSLSHFWGKCRAVNVGSELFFSLLGVAVSVGYIIAATRLRGGGARVSPSQ